MSDEPITCDVCGGPLSVTARGGFFTVVQTVRVDDGYTLLGADVSGWCSDCHRAMELAAV